MRSMRRGSLVCLCGGGGDGGGRLTKAVGLRYVVFVNGRSREVVMEDMRRRIDAGDVEAEKRTAIEVCYMRWPGGGRAGC